MNHKEIIAKLVKIAKTQRKIINRLAQDLQMPADKITANQPTGPIQLDIEIILKKVNSIIESKIAALLSQNPTKKESIQPGPKFKVQKAILTGSVCSINLIPM